MNDKQHAARHLLDTLAASNGSLADDHQTWEAHRTEVGFALPFPTPPAAQPVPEKPDHGQPPREDDPKYDVELSTLDKLLSSRRIKKQQAALNRFEKDRKAWNEDKAYATGIYEQAKKRHTEQAAEQDAAYREAVAEWKSAFESYLRDLADVPAE